VDWSPRDPLLDSCMLVGVNDVGLVFSWQGDRSFPFRPLGVPLFVAPLDVPAPAADRQQQGCERSSPATTNAPLRCVRPWPGRDPTPLSKAMAGHHDTLPFRQRDGSRRTARDRFTRTGIALDVEQVDGVVEKRRSATAPAADPATAGQDRRGTGCTQRREGG